LQFRHYGGSHPGKEAGLETKGHQIARRQVEDATRSFLGKDISKSVDMFK